MIMDANKKLFKVIAAFLALVLLFMCASCSNKGNTIPEETSAETSEEIIDSPVFSEDLAKKCEDLITGKIVHGAEGPDYDGRQVGDFTIFDTDKDGFPDLLFLGAYRDYGNLYHITENGIELISDNLKGYCAGFFEGDREYHMYVKTWIVATSIESYADYIISYDLSSVNCNVGYMSAHFSSEIGNVDIMKYSDVNSDECEKATYEEYIQFEQKYNEVKDEHGVNDYNIAKYLYEDYGLNYSESSKDIYYKGLAEYLDKSQNGKITNDSVGLLVDLNGDGIDDVIYTEGSVPCVLIFCDGMVFYNAFAVTDSSFPEDSEKSGVWFDAADRIIVVREGYKKAKAYNTEMLLQSSWEISGDEYTSEESFDKKFGELIFNYGLVNFYEATLPLDEILDKARNM